MRIACLPQEHSKGRRDVLTLVHTAECTAVRSGVLPALLDVVDPCVSITYKAGPIY